MESKCRMCSQHEETVDHIVSGCEVLAKTEYISRHNNAVAYLHWSICKGHDIEITDKWYEHEPETVMHNKDSNITIKDSVNSTGKLIDMTVSSDRNIALKETEKKKKVQRPRTRNTENVASENSSDPCGCWCAWYSEEGYGRKHQESIRES